MSILNLFPARIRFVNPDGTLTPEAARMFEVLMGRVGGMAGDSGMDMFGAQGPDAVAHDAIMQPLPVDMPAADIVQGAAHGSAGDEMIMQPLQYAAGTGLRLANLQFALADTAATPGSYGNAGTVAKFDVDQQGRLIFAQNVPILIDSYQVTGLGTMAAQNVGTNFTGSFTGMTVTVSNGIITSVV